MHVSVVAGYMIAAGTLTNCAESGKGTTTMGEDMLANTASLNLALHKQANNIYEQDCFLMVEES